jgi:hypothetical protein
MQRVSVHVCLCIHSAERGCFPLALHMCAIHSSFSLRDAAITMNVLVGLAIYEHTIQYVHIFTCIHMFIVYSHVCARSSLLEHKNQRMVALVLGFAFLHVLFQDYRLSACLLTFQALTRD